jgi:hypothetical protein
MISQGCIEITIDSVIATRTFTEEAIVCAQGSGVGPNDVVPCPRAVQTVIIVMFRRKIFFIQNT